LFLKPDLEKQTGYLVHFYPIIKRWRQSSLCIPGLDGLAKGEVESVSRYFGLTAPIETEGEGLLTDALNIFNNCSILDNSLKKLGIIRI
jgi:hypothetical protein